MKRIIFGCLVLVSALLYSATPKGWTDDFANAQKTAAKEKKSLMVLFTGSDWCPWCVRLEQEIISQDAFAEFATKKLVCVFLDFPSDETLISEKVRLQNRELARKYGIRGFPTILIMDAEGNVTAKTGYRRGGAKAYVTHLEELLKSKE